ncbi:MAG TPA: HlyD family efflux transporter periplasmic adaptor subunit, partial [Terrimesophilobacter sp.]|nr:HlyD family efflux transporter periplasmic adaptor subunit [Terrimesophilobacter sp.]
MGVWRKWIFPIIRIIVFAAIAAALVKIAFFPDVAAVSDPAVPGAEIVEPQVPVMRGTVQNDVSLQGTISADAAVPAKAPAMGAVHKVFVKEGKAVRAGTVLMTIWTEVPRENGTFWYKESKVTAPTTGILSSLPVIVDQLVSVGESVAQIAPASFHVSGSLPPEQQYRLLDQPTEAQVSITGGPAPFTCTGLTITTPLAGSEGDGGTGGGTTVTCAVPSDVRVFAGLAAELTIAG